jgi:Fur family transcriptional regulator, ferric uptake regulator
MEQTLDDVHRYLREKGLRNTAARRTILDAVFGEGGHFTAEDLLDRLKGHGEKVSRASVYRTLGLLVDGGFVETREFQRAQMMYEPVLGRHHHDHLICTVCGTIVEFENEAIERLQDGVAREHGFTLDRHSLRLYGRCARCVREARTAAPVSDGRAATPRRGRR